jgi:hypothetical protein
MTSFMRGRAAARAALLALALLGHAALVRAADAPAHPVQLAQARGTEPRELEPRYQPAPPEEVGWYNSGYFFALTRGVAGSTMVPALKAPLFVFTVPLDVALLPFAAIGGLFG